MGDRRGEKISFREKNGEEFDQVKVALIHVFEQHVPDEFGVGGHVVVSDHAAVPPAAELHADVSSDEVVRMRRRRVSGRKVGGGGIVGKGLPGTLPAPWVGGACGGGENGGETPQFPPRWAFSWGKCTRGHCIVPS